MLARKAVRMSNRTLAASQRTRAIAQHMHASTDAAAAPKPRTGNEDEAPVLFETFGQVRKFRLNRPKKLNALDTPMLNLLRPYVEEWSRSELSKILVGTGEGRAFCAGGDVAGVVQLAEKEETRPQAIDFFKREFELDYLLAAVPKPYVAVMDGITMGGGVGLSINAAFRIATENTVFAMPETKIGYCPDVGATYFLARLDGEIGTYLGLTGESIKGRDVFELGLATHYIPSRRVPDLLERLSSFDKPTNDAINRTIEEASQERESHEPRCAFRGELRVVLDSCFSKNTVEEIVAALTKVAKDHSNEGIRKWAQETLDALALRSPTSLKVALLALRKGRVGTLHSALQTELNIATAFCSGASTDFRTGVNAVLVERTKERPAWSPAALEDVKDSDVRAKFFGQFSPENGTAPALEVPQDLVAQPSKVAQPWRYTLPRESEIQQVVVGDHATSGGYALTREEVLDKFHTMRQGKMGVVEKVAEVLLRKTVEEPDKETGRRYVKWKN